MVARQDPVTLPGDVVRRSERFSLYNSPYPAHRRGCAVDLYPGEDAATSPVAGEILDTRTARCPSRPYAVDEDHLILVDCGDVVARVLHVDPSVDPGESVAIGDELGDLVRSGFFGQWVDNHVHLGFRRREQNLRRATGSLPLELDVTVDGLPWDGTGEVAEIGPTYVLLDAPSYDGGRTGDGFAAIASDEGVPLDGGLVHYSGGGGLAGRDAGAEGALSLLGTPVGSVDGRDVTWRDVAVLANGERATGLSMFASRVPFGAKVVFHEGHDFAVGDHVEVTIEPTADPVRLG